MTGPDAFHLHGGIRGAGQRQVPGFEATKAQVTSVRVDTHGWEGEEIFYFKHPDGRKTLDRRAR